MYSCVCFYCNNVKVECDFMTKNAKNAINKYIITPPDMKIQKHHSQHLDNRNQTVRKQEIIPLLLNCLNPYSTE